MIAASVGVLFCSLLTVRLIQGMPADLDHAGEGGAVLLKPDDWTGRVFPLGNYVRWQGAAPALMDGEWLIVLHRRGCAVCRKLLDQLALDGWPATSSQRIALIEVEDFVPESELESEQDQDGGTERPWKIGHLTGDRTWFVETPTLIALKDGVIQRSPELSKCSLVLAKGGNDATR